MKAKVKHLYEIIAGAILSLLGFSACTIIGPDMYGPGPATNAAEYGMPHANYIVRGSVHAQESGKPIPGIRATVRYGVPSNGKILYNQGAPVESDKDGKVDAYDSVYPAEKIEVILEDVDGEDNGGLFQRDTLREDRLTIEQTKKADDGWYRGEYTVTFDAKLK
jgi:putative lipoprotein (rSAM/lipoprotein system)